tara:strand:- start:1155 stop:1634 length:480 start_codon:yes stop_codon:yes gene_type:complete
MNNTQKHGIVKLGYSHLSEDEIKDILTRGILEEKGMMEVGQEVSRNEPGKAALIGAALGGGLGAGLGAKARTGYLGTSRGGLKGGLAGGAMGAGAGGLLGYLISKIKQFGAGLGFNEARQGMIDAMAYEKGLESFGDAPGFSNRKVYDALKERIRERGL